MKSGIPISKNIIFTNSIYSILSRIINISLIIWLQSFLIRRIPTDEYALYPVFMSGMMFLLLLKSILSSGLVRYYSDAKARHNEEYITRIASTMFAISFVVSLIAFGLGIILTIYINDIFTIPSFYSTDAKIIVFILITSFSLQVLLSPFVVGIHVEQKFLLENLIEISSVIVRLLLLLFLLFGVSTQIIWVAVANEAANITGLFMRFIISRQLIPELRIRLTSIDIDTAKTILSFGTWTFISQVAYRIKTHSDPIILNKFGSSLDVTCFYIGNMLLQQFNMLFLRVSQTFIPSLTALNVTEQHQRLKNIFIRYNRVMIWLFMLAANPIIIFRNELVNLYIGNHYISAAMVMFLLFSSEAISKSYAILPNLTIATGQMKFISISNIILQFSNLILTIILVIFFNMGAVGAALSTLLITITLQTLILVPYSLRLSGVSFSLWLKQTLFPGYLPSFLVLLIFLILQQKLPPIERWDILIIYSIIVVAVYIIIVYFLGFKQQDKKDLNEIFLSLCYALNKFFNHKRFL